MDSDLLELLLATDDQVQDDFSFLCKLIDDTSSDRTSGESDVSLPSLDQFIMDKGTTKTKASSKRKASQEPLPAAGAKNLFQYRQRQELKQLREQVDLLQAQLATEWQKHQRSTNGQDSNVISPWEQAAREELIERNRANIENRQLKQALVELSTFLDQMQRVFAKRPRTAMISENTPSDAWQALKLTAQHSLRVAAMHAISDRQYRKMQHAFINAGLFQSTQDGLASATTQLQSDGSILLELKRQSIVPAPFRIVSQALWSALAACTHNPEAALHVVDDSTIYERFSCIAGQATVHCNTIRKFYAEDSRDVILWRTVLEDVLVPNMDRGVVNNEIQCAPTSDPEVCRITSLTQVRVNPKQPPQEIMGILQRGVERFGLEKVHDAENEEVQVDSEVTEALMAYNKRLQQAIVDFIAKAVQAYRAQTS
ncbi:unnamed protein product [Aphanomyces euteiches]|uniref:Uncharacterized protein n=1 Tax=Aphanomyces euteiches TaxID=100861 RepID=A0A6G0X7N3_9STRA|nr:hypothetical protein Ae201684_007598 [Aphanomyces euteiches]